MSTPTNVPQTRIAFTASGPVKIVSPNLNVLFQVWHNPTATKVIGACNITEAML
jgi:hypothetical protein